MRQFQRCSILAVGALMLAATAFAGRAPDPIAADPAFDLEGVWQFRSDFKLDDEWVRPSDPGYVVYGLKFCRVPGSNATVSRYIGRYTHANSSAFEATVMTTARGTAVTISQFHAANSYAAAYSATYFPAGQSSLQIPVVWGSWHDLENHRGNFQLQERVAADCPLPGPSPFR